MESVAIVSKLRRGDDGSNMLITTTKAGESSSALFDESSAAHRCFATPELLEMILLQVLMHTRPSSQADRDANASAAKSIFFSQRVNKTFQATIQGSTKLRAALWLNEIALWVYPDREVIYLINPIFNSSELINSPLHYLYYDEQRLTHRLYMSYEGLCRYQDPKYANWRNAALFEASDEHLCFRLEIRDSTVGRYRRRGDVMCSVTIARSGTMSVGQFLDQMKAEMQREVSLALDDEVYTRWIADKEEAWTLFCALNAD